MSFTGGQSACLSPRAEGAGGKAFQEHMTLVQDWNVTCVLVVSPTASKACLETVTMHVLQFIASLCHHEL